MKTDTKTKPATISSPSTTTGTGLAVRSLDDLPKIAPGSGAENLCILGDTSGSMSSNYSGGKTRLQGLQDALNAIWEITDWSACATTCFMFSDETREIPFESSAPPKVESAQWGGTSFCEALDAALRTKPTRIILASDGAAEYPEGQIGKCQEGGITIDTIYIGSNDEVPGALLLRRISDETGGIFTLCKNAHELVEQFQQLETHNRLALDYTPSEESDVIKL
jgi:hypothetical protein